MKQKVLISKHLTECNQGEMVAAELNIKISQHNQICEIETGQASEYL